jgi:hypothetical protein
MYRGFIAHRQLAIAYQINKPTSKAFLKCQTFSGLERGEVHVVRGNPRPVRALPCAEIDVAQI